MKKISILFSFLFLFLVAVSSDSNAQALGCSGTPAACGDNARQGTSRACTGTEGATTGMGCAFNAGVCSNSPAATACNTSTNPGQCNAISGCIWRSAATADNNAFVDTLCNALKIVTGSGGKAFAAFAIISCGIGFFTGKISWGLMIGITCGIAAMFGAPTIVAAISGGTAVDCAAS